MKKLFFVICIFSCIYSNSYSQQGWNLQFVPSYVSLNSIQFVNDSTGYSVGSDYANGSFVFLKTTNGGTNWVSQYAVSGGNHNNPLNLYFTDALTGYSVGGDAFVQYPGNIFKTTNGGTNWVLTYLQDTTIYRGICFPNQNTGYISGVYGELLKTTNAGNNWVHLNSGTSNALLSIYFVDNSTGFIAGANGTILKTTDAGNNWSNQISNTALSVRSIHFENSNLGFACGSDTYGNYHVILKTTNSGNNWLVVLEEPVSSPNHFKSIYFTNTNEGYVAGSNRILKTTNSGDNWFFLDIQPANNFIEDRFGCSISFTNSSTGYICGYSNGNSAIIKTTNAGISVPNSPNGLSGTYYRNPRRVTLNWNDNSYIEIGFKIERKISSDTLWSTIDSVAQNIKQYNDTRLDSGYNVYEYRILAYNMIGLSGYSNIATIIVTNLNLIENKVINVFSIDQNHPNPFNPVTKIKFEVPKLAFVEIKVFDLLGREVKTLMNENLKPGTYETSFDGTQFSSGIYFYRLVTDGFSETKKMLLIK